MRSVFVSIVLFIASCVVGLQTVQAQAIDKILFTTNSGGPDRMWESDTVILTLEGSLLTIVGRMPTGDQARPVQALTMKVRNFSASNTLPRTYPLVAGDGTWQNYAGKNGVCNCQQGSVTITQLDSNSRLQATFSFDCGTEFQSGSVIVTHITQGVVSGVIPIELKVKIKPGEIFTTQPDKDVTLAITVVNAANDKPVTGATVVCKDNPILQTQNFDVGVTDQTGQFKYTFKVPDTIKDKDTFELKFSARKDKASDASIVSQKIVVEPDARYYYFKCLGLPVIEYDAGEGEKWEKTEGSPIIKASGSSVMINRFLKWEGDKFEIDTTPNSERVLYTGKLVCPDCEDAGLPGDIFLESEAFLLTTFGPNCDGIMKLLAAKQTGLKFMGIALKLDELMFLPGWEDPGIRVKFTLEADVSNDLSAQCLKSNDPGHRSISGAFNWRKSGFDKIEFEAKNLGLGKVFCFNELAASYDFDKLLLNLAARATIEELVDNKATEIKTSVALRADTTGPEDHVYLKDFMLQISSESQCFAIPVQPEFCIKGGRINAGFDTEKGVRKWNFGLTGIFKLTIETLSQRFKFIENWAGAVGGEKPEIVEVELGGKYEYPAKFSGSGLVKIAKIPYISVTKPWQALVDATQTLDFTQGLTGRGGIRIAHLGMDDFFASLTNCGYNLTFNPFDMSVSGNGALRIPQVGTELNEAGLANFLRWIRSFNVTNINLGTGNVYLGVNEKDGFHFSLNCDVSQNPVAFIRSYGRMFIDLKFSPSEGLVADWGDAYAHLSTFRRSDPSGLAGKKAGPSVQAMPLDTFTVTPDIQRFFVFISGEVGSAAPNSTLISPSGTSYTTTTQDSTVIKFQSDNGELVQWVVVNPEDGDWKIQLENPKQTDEVRISALRNERSFTIGTSVANRVLTVTWDANGFSAGDRISFVLDDDKEGFNGVAIGTTDAMLGTYSYTMTDTLPACSYYVAATRAASGMDIVTAYSDVAVSTGKTVLAPPANVFASTNTTDGVTTITWTPSSDPSVATYIIYADIDGSDTVLAYAERYESQRVIATPNFGGRGLYIVSANEDGIQGCPSPTTQSVVSVEEEVVAGRDNSNVFVVPNPAESSATVYVKSVSNSMLQTSIVNSVGMEVYTTTNSIPATGFTTIPLKLDGLNSGMYYVVVKQDGVLYSTPLAISK